MVKYNELYKRFKKSEFGNDIVDIVIANEMECIDDLEDAFFNDKCALVRELYLDNDFGSVTDWCNAVVDAFDEFDGDEVIDWSEVYTRAAEIAICM